MNRFSLVLPLLLSATASAQFLSGAEPLHRVGSCLIYPKHLVHVDTRADYGEGVTVRARVKTKKALAPEAECQSQAPVVFTRDATDRAFFAGIIEDVLFVDEADSSSILFAYRLSNSEQLFRVPGWQDGQLSKEKRELRFTQWIDSKCKTFLQENDVSESDCRSKLEAAQSCVDQLPRFGGQPRAPVQAHLFKGGKNCQYSIREWLSFSFATKQLRPTGQTVVSLANEISD